MRTIARALIDARTAVRFRIWITRFRFEVWRHGGRLVVDAPYGAEFDGPPVIKATSDGEGGGTTVLRLGRGVRLGRGMTIEVWARGENLLQVGDTGRFLNNVRILLRSGSVTFGNFVLIRDGVWIKSDGRFVAGDEFLMGSWGTIHCTERIEIEELVGFGERVSVTDSDHGFDATDGHYMRAPLTVAPVRISRGTMCGFGSTVLKGARIGPNSVVGANAVVNGREYPPAAVIAGNPAKVVKDLGESPAG